MSEIHPIGGTAEDRKCIFVGAEPVLDIELLGAAMSRACD
jgi:hypothetical protein